VYKVNHILVAIAFCLFITIYFSESALAKEQAGKETSYDYSRTMKTKYSKVPLDLDGKLDEPVWQETNVYVLGLADDMLHEGRTLDEVGYARLVWDDNYLYIGIDFKDSSLRATGEEDNLMHAELGDVCNFFLKPQGKPYYWEFYATPRGKYGCLFFRKKGGEIQFDKDFDIKVAVDTHGTLNDDNDIDQRWMAEIAIPIKNLTSRGDSFTPDQKWRILVARYNYSHQLRFGDLELTMTPKLSRTSYHLLDEHAFLVLESSNRIDGTDDFNTGNKCQLSSLRIAVKNQQDKVLAEEKGDKAELVLVYQNPYLQGDKIKFFGPVYMAIKLDMFMPEVIVYNPGGVYEYTIPVDREYPSCPPGAYQGDTHYIRTRKVDLAELMSYRNIALNPYGTWPQKSYYPHATSNSQWHSNNTCLARNAIDGYSYNKQHGPWPYQSWGPDKRDDLWWKLDFGRKVEVDKVRIYVRSDFPHDNYWHKGLIKFSDGSSIPISLEKSSDVQVINFPKKVVDSLEITELKQQDQPLRWCAFTEVEVWGRDIVQ